jgi:hypothetical protein
VSISSISWAAVLEPVQRQAHAQRSQAQESEPSTETLLQRHSQGLVTDGAQLARIEAHLLTCEECRLRAARAAREPTPPTPAADAQPSVWIAAPTPAAGNAPAVSTTVKAVAARSDQPLTDHEEQSAKSDQASPAIWA